MKKIRANRANLIIIVVTFVLFVGALFTKGFTHDLFLEGAVFLVSVKLILATYNIHLLSERIDHRLDRIEKAVSEESE